MQNPKSEINIKENQIVFRLSIRNYPLEAIYNAAYVFIDRAYIFLSGNPKKEIKVFLKGKKKLNANQLQSFRGEFLNEMLNSILRKKIFKDSEKMLEFIVAGVITTALEKREDGERKENEMEEIEKEISILKKELDMESPDDYQKDILNIRKIADVKSNAKNKRNAPNDPIATALEKREDGERKENEMEEIEKEISILKKELDMESPDDCQKGSLNIKKAARIQPNNKKKRNASKKEKK